MSVIEPPIPVEQVTAWEHRVDIVVAGLGVAGVCAALEAHRAGAEVLALERASGGGGASATSEGIFYLGGGTALQRDLGYDDDPDNMYRFMRSVTSTPEDDKLRMFCDASTGHFDWLEQQGVPFERRAFTGKAVAVNTGEGLLSTGNEKVWPFREDATPVMRGHQARATKEIKGGASAMKALLATFAAEQVPVRYDVNVVALVVDGGQVCGVKVRELGKEWFVEARAGVVLAMGSFNLNRDLTSKNLGPVAEFGKPLGVETNDGAGLLLGQSVGGATQGMDGAIATASIYPPADNIKGIVVNKLGERFVAEDSYHGRLAWHIERQPDHTAYLIVDEEIFGYPEKGSHKLVDAWDTAEEMEKGLDVPEGSLRATLDEYNRDVNEGEDRRFHKYKDWLKPLLGPYAAFNLSFWSSDYHYIALGGLRTDANARVLGSDGEPIAGLYAAGACAAHFPMTGAEYASGMSLGPGSFFGRQAGRHAAAHAAKGPAPMS